MKPRLYPLALFLFSCVGSFAITPSPTVINVSEVKEYPTLESVMRAFSQAQKPEVMFIGVTHRIKESSLDQIAENGLTFFETHPANLSSLLSQILAYGNISQRILRGEAASAASRKQLRRQMAAIIEARRQLYYYLEHVPSGNKILVPRNGKICDIREQIELIARDCDAAAKALI